VQVRTVLLTNLVKCTLVVIWLGFLPPTFSRQARTPCDRAYVYGHFYVMVRTAVVAGALVVTCSFELNTSSSRVESFVFAGDDGRRRVLAIVINWLVKTTAR